MQRTTTRRERLRTRDLAFLPAAMELEQTPPSRSGPLLIWAITAFTVGAFAWAWFGRVDIVAVAPGRIVPVGQSKTIQPFERGIVVAIHVREGQRVAPGDPLISLDDRSARADEHQAERALAAARRNWVTERAFNAFLADGSQSAAALVAETTRRWDEMSEPANPAQLTGLLQARIAEFQAELATLENDRRARGAEREQARALVRRYQRLAPITGERLASIESLYRRKLAARDQYLGAEQTRIELEENLAAERARVAELDSELAGLATRIGAARSRAEHQNLVRLQEAEDGSYRARQTLRKARLQSSRLQLTAPISGTVTDLAVHTVGGIVTPAQVLMSLVPDHGQWLVEARVDNRDIGFIREGQTGVIKVDAFNFTRFGTIEGRLATIAENSVQAPDGGLVFPVQVLPASRRMLIDGRWVPLSAGMAVTVEIRTGTRRIIDYFLSPIARHRSESIRER